MTDLKIEGILSEIKSQARIDVEENLYPKKKKKKSKKMKIDISNPFEIIEKLDAHIIAVIENKTTCLCKAHFLPSIISNGIKLFLDTFIKYNKHFNPGPKIGNNIMKNFTDKIIEDVNERFYYTLIHNDRKITLEVDDEINALLHFLESD